MSAPAAAATEVRPGSRLGPYEIVAPLESGGMATLFLGRRASSPELFAIKIVRPHLARDAGYVQMFIDEARLGARLVHPNIIRTEQLGQHEGIHYLAMEYVNGVTLAQLMEWLVRTRRGLSPSLAVHIAECIARALHVAHELRDPSGRRLEVVHRDISPQNILLSHRGEVKLIDFGVAKSRGRNWATVEGSLKGKLGYMSPEQALGQTIDRRTDVYALGVVLWESLTQRRLFFGETTELLARVQKPSIVSPRAIVPSLSPALDDVVMRALRPRPEERIATAAELADALKACARESPLDVEALGALVCLAMEEIRAKEEVDETLRDALRVAPPTSVRTAHALAVFTREMPAMDLLPSALEPAPFTRASPPVRSYRAWVIAAVALLGLVVGTGLFGAAFWLWSSTSAPVATPASAPLPVSQPPIVRPTVPTVPPPTVPLGLDVPAEGLPADEVAAGDHREHGEHHRRRSREEPPALPPPFIGSAGPPIGAATSATPSGAPSRIPLPPPANRPDSRGTPVRIPPPGN